MIIYKDKKYFKIYLFTLIFDFVALILGISFLIIFLKNIPTGFLLIISIIALIIFLLLIILAFIFGINSMRGYLKIPYELVKVENDEINVLGNKLSLNDLLEVYKEVYAVSRSTFAIKLVFNNACFILKDVLNLNESYKLLKNLVKETK